MTSSNVTFALVDANGQHVMSGMSDAAPEIPGAVDVGVLPPTIYHRWDFATSAWLEVPERPSIHHTFNWTSFEWEDLRALAERKAAKWEEIKRARDAAESGGFPYLGKQIDSDAVSVQRISVAAAGAMLAPEEYTIDWTCADNTVLTLTRDQMVAMPAALALYGNHLHQVARAVRQEIEAATTVAEVEALAYEP